MKKSQLLLTLASALLLLGCSSKQTPSITDNSNYDSDVTEDITTDGDTNNYDTIETETEDVEIPSEYDEFENGEIKKAGNYYLKGDYTSISITASKGTELFVFLDGANISSNSGIAFSSSKQVVLHLVVLNNSTNTIENDFLDENAFNVKGNVYISGEGTINVTSKQKNGMKVSKDLFVYEGVTLNVNGANHAITARSITSTGATINVTSQAKDGIQLECDSDALEFTNEQGYAYLIDTKFTADTYGDGIQADTFIYISGGEYNITTHGEFVSYSSSAMTEYGLSKDDFKYVKSGDSYKRVAADEIRNLNSSYYALANSVKGLKVNGIEYDSDKDDVDDTVITTGDYQIYIAHLANLTINSADDCIHTNYGDVNIENSNLNLETFDDGAHADYELTVNNASISIANSYEGLEGANVTINGASTNIVTNSEDDGINAASDYVSQNTIIINDGYLRVYASGDGIDANTALYINGGTVIVEGPGRNNGSLDAEQIYFNGGIVLACSTNGMRERMSATQHTFLWQGSTIAAGTKVSVVDKDNVALFSYTLKQSCTQVIFSHPNMAKDQTYRLFSGNTSLASITMTSTLVTSGSGQGGPGGGGGPGRP